MTDPTPAEILALPLGPEGKWRSTMRGYLIKFDGAIQGAAPGSRPFGQGIWRRDIDKAFVEAGWVGGKLAEDGSVTEVDADAVDRLVRSAMAALAVTGA